MGDIRQVKETKGMKMKKNELNFVHILFLLASFVCVILCQDEDAGVYIVTLKQALTAHFYFTQLTKKHHSNNTSLSTLHNPRNDGLVPKRTCCCPEPLLP